MEINKILCLIYLFALGSIISLETRDLSSLSHTSLKFNENGEFTILQFTDLHYGEDEEKDVNSAILQEKLISAVNPDLVVVTGDSVSGYAWDKSDTFYQSCWNKWTNPMLKRKVHYAYTLGNHDDQANLSRDNIILLDKTHPYSLIKNSTGITGATNYILPILSKDSSTVGYILWFLDTNDEGCLGHSGWGCINPDQIKWYEDKSAKIKEILGKTVSGLGFFHIPLPEYINLWNEGLTYGRRHEGVCSPDYNTGFFDKLLQVGSMKGVFCGHDHSNDFGGFWKDIELVYGRKTGYGGYGPDGLQRGGRIITLKEEKGIYSYSHRIIQEDLSIIENEVPKWQGGNPVKNCDG